MAFSEKLAERIIKAVDHLPVKEKKCSGVLPLWSMGKCV